MDIEKCLIFVISCPKLCIKGIFLNTNDNKPCDFMQFTGKIREKVFQVVIFQNHNKLKQLNQLK
jgi:hypothetical protein